MAEQVLFASASRTATSSSPVVNGNRCKALVVVIDVTAITATPSVVFTVEVVDSLSGKFPAVLTSAAVTATGTTVLTIGQGVTAVANVSSGQAVPENVRVTATHGDADAITYTVSCHKIR
jgi:hypothetical protein